MKVKLTEAEKLAKQELRDKLRELLGGGHDLKAINELVGKLKSDRDAVR